MHRRYLQDGIDYIENNLFMDLLLEDCAKAAGYSLYHYCRVFSSTMGIPVKEYIRRRRVSESVKMMNETSLSLKEISYRCGFNSQENYIRVFKSFFGIAPTDYKKTRYPMKPLEQGGLPVKELKEPDYSLFEEPQVIMVDSFKVAGKRCLTTFENERQFEDVPVFWNQYYAQRIYEQLGYFDDDIRVDYGISILDEDNSDLYDENNQRKGLDFNYLTGAKMTNIMTLPDGLETITIPAGYFAAFHHQKADEYNLIHNLIDTWRYIDYYWLPNSDYEHAGRYEFNEYYPHLDRLSKTIYIPVRLKQ